MIKSKIVAEDAENIIADVGAERMVEKLKGKTVLVAGATGMVGSYFIYVLSALNEKYDANIRILACLRNRKRMDESLLTDKYVEILEHDVTEPFEVEGAVDYIIHAASPASPLIMKSKPLETNFANTLGMANVVKLALAKKSAGTLFISSREIYGEPNEGQEFFTEDGPLGQVNPLIPRNGYAEGKKAAENMCISAKDEYGLDAKVVRLAHTYGPGMSIYDGRVQADFLKNIMEKTDIVLKSDGSSVRTYTYIADAICGMFLVLLFGEDSVYNIADEESKTSIRELAETLVDLPEAEGLELKFEIDDSNKKGTASFSAGILSTEKIRNEFGWKPRYSIHDGFQRTIKHLEEELK